MRVIKVACCLLLMLGIMSGFISAIAEGDPIAWIVPISLAIVLLSLGLAKVGRAHPSEHPRSFASCYRVYAYGLVALSVFIIGVFLYAAVTADIISTPILAACSTNN